MRYRRFGRTNLSMPVFSCGGMRYQHSWQDLALATRMAEVAEIYQLDLLHVHYAIPHSVSALLAKRNCI